MTELGDYLTFHDARLKRRFANRRMPMATLYDIGCGWGTLACFQVVLYKNLDAYDRARFVGARGAATPSGDCRSSATR